MNIKDPYSAAAAALSLGQHFLILEPEDVILDAEALASRMLLIPGLAAAVAADLDGATGPEDTTFEEVTTTFPGTEVCLPISPDSRA